MIYKFSRKGNYHDKKLEEIQDYTCSEVNDRFVVLALADGVSTCKFAAEGAKVAAEALKNLMIAKAEYFFELDKEKTADYLISHVLYELNSYIANREGKIEDYSSTLAGIIFDLKEERYLLFNLGDSIILGSGYGRIDVLGKPADSLSGCPVTTTKNVLSHISIVNSDSGNYESLMICSDGCWREFYSRNVIKEQVAAMINEKDYEALSDFLNNSKPEDDSSFIVCELK